MTKFYFSTIRLPNDIQLKRVEHSSDVEKVNSVWSHRKPSSLAFVQRMAKYNPSIGAYKDDNTLVAWIFR